MAARLQRIGLLAPDLSYQHGWAHASLALIEALRGADVPLTVVTAENSPDVPGLLLHKRLPPVTPIARLMPARLAQIVPAVRELLADCDLIHATVEPYAPLAAWVAGRRPYCVTAHGTYVQLGQMSRPPFNWIYRRALRRAHLICVSHYTERVAQRVLPGVQTTVIANGVDADSMLRLLDRRGEAHPPTVLAVGAVKARKGTLELARAMAAVRTAIPDARCIVIGREDPAYGARVREEAARLGLGEAFQLAGYITQEALREAYSRADVFCVPSIPQGMQFEGFGLVYLEASAAGLPVIGTTESGAADAIEPGVTGLLVNSARLETELPAALIRLLRDPALRAQMGAAGRVKAAAQTWTRVAAQVNDLYHNLIARAVR